MQQNTFWHQNFSTIAKSIDKVDMTVPSICGYFYKNKTTLKTLTKKWETIDTVEKLKCIFETGQDRAEQLTQHAITYVPLRKTYTHFSLREMMDIYDIGILGPILDYIPDLSQPFPVYMIEAHKVACELLFQKLANIYVPYIYGRHKNDYARVDNKQFLTAHAIEQNTTQLKERTIFTAIKTYEPIKTPFYEFLPLRVPVTHEYITGLIQTSKNVMNDLSCLQDITITRVSPESVKFTSETEMDIINPVYAITLYDPDNCPLLHYTNEFIQPMTKQVLTALKELQGQDDLRAGA